MAEATRFRLWGESIMGIYDNEEHDGQVFKIRPRGRGFVPFTLELDVDTMDDLRAMIRLFDTWDDDVLEALVEYEGMMKERVK